MRIIEISLPSRGMLSKNKASDNQLLKDYVSKVNGAIPWRRGDVMSIPPSNGFGNRNTTGYNIFEICAFQKKLYKHHVL